MYAIKLSAYAKIFYTEWLLSPDSVRYNMVFDQTFYGDLDVVRLTNALRRYVCEHVLLNSHVRKINDELHWVKNTCVDDLVFSAPEDVDTLSEYTSKSFDLHSGPLYRFKLIKIDSGIFRFVAVFHHILIDGSGSLDSGVFEAISSYYNDDSFSLNLSVGRQIELISDFTEKTDLLLNEHDNFQTFWHEKLLDVEYIDLSFLKLHRKNESETISKKTSNTIKEILFDFGAADLANLKVVKTKYGVSFYVYGLCIFALLLYRYSGQRCLAISFPLAIKEGADFIYGAQINTNLIVFQFDSSTTIFDLFEQALNWFRATVRHEKNGYCPITGIVQNEDKQLLNANFIQSFFREHPFKFKGITKVEISTEFSTDSVTKGSLLFEQDARNNKLNYRVRYYKGDFDNYLLKKFIKIFKQQFIATLKTLVCKNADIPICRYSILGKKEYQKIVFDFNKTDEHYPRNKTITILFEEQVLKTPDKVAVVCEDRKLTYRELNQKANQLAHYLLQCYRIKSDDLIVLCLDKNEYMLIALFATLKSGAAYVPIDPSNPDDRISYILNDTQSTIVITNNSLKKRLRSIINKCVLKKVNLIVDEHSIAKLIRQTDSNPITKTTSNNLMYVIYTSGTTGKPKGTLLEHHGLVNFVTYMIKEAKLDTESNGCKYASFGFDASATEIFPIILSGGTLHILNNEDRMDPKKTNDYFNRHNITYAFLPTKFAELFFKEKNQSLHYLIVAGEKLETFIKQSYHVINGYGPTEASVHTTSFLVNKPYHNIPIGKPINNVKCYVVDKNINPLPIGAIGELLIGGEGLARGYLNQSDLSAKKFVINPFQTNIEKQQNKNGRLYKTGDLVRQLPDGVLEYIGRNDFQVKIRGFRIELGEIEGKLKNYPKIKQSIVVVRENKTTRSNNKYLVAYYTADTKLDERKIRKDLSKHLPDYMLPSSLIYLDKIPFTVNGKVNIKALPNPMLNINENYVKPSNEQEEIICQALCLSSSQLLDICYLIS